MVLRTFFIVVFSLMLVVASISGEDWFPITAWGISQNVAADTSFWVAEIDTGWHGNSIMTFEKGGSAGESIAQ